jgi:hypothetical protein
MFPRMASVVLASLILAATTAAGEEGTAHAPLSAVASKSAAGVTVLWIPAVEGADAFNVYGVRDGARTLLETTPGTSIMAEVAAGFPGYAVAGMRDGTESPPIMAFVTPAPCVTVDPGVPPEAGVGNCPISILPPVPIPP